jgi:hypothetical protein
MLFCLDGMSIEIKKLLFILIGKTVEDINISSENLVEVNLFIYDISRVKMYGMEMVYVLLILMETLLKMYCPIFQRSAQKML